jgi:hypothetical protein
MSAQTTGNTDPHCDGMVIRIRSFRSSRWSSRFVSSFRTQRMILDGRHTDAHWVR